MKKHFITLTKREETIFQLTKQELMEELPSKFVAALKKETEDNTLLIGEGISVIASKKDLKKLKKIEDTWVRDGLIR